MHQELKTDRQSLRDSLKEFLDFQSKIPLRTVHCEECGSACSYLSAEFWLDGDEDVFSIPLPFCLDCNPEVSLPKPEIS